MSAEDAAASLPSPPSHGYSNDSPSYSPSFSPSPAPETHSAPGRPALSRALNPAPIVTKLTPGVTIATASSPDSAYPSPGVGTPCTGPTSTNYVVPPRPKPGRKPATDEPASKRKAQNRESQRAFRARKAAKLNEMKTQAEVAELRHRQDMQQKMMDLADKERRIRQLEQLVDQLKESQERTAQERDAWKDKALHLEDFVKRKQEQGNNSPAAWRDTYPSPSTFTPTTNNVSNYDLPKNDDIGCGSCKVDGPCICLEAMANEAHATVFLPPVSINLGGVDTSSPPSKPILATTSAADPALFAEREIDFTAQFSSNKRPRLDIAFLTQPTKAEAGATEAGCGFCTADSYCVCRDMMVSDIPSSSHDDRPPGNRHNADTVMLDSRPTTTSSKRVASGPGTCSDCMANPKQRAWCQRISQLRSSGNEYFSRPPSSRRSSIVSTASNDIGSPMEPRTNYSAVPERERSIGCSDAFKLFEGRVATDRDTMDWSTLKPMAPDTHRDSLPSLQAASRKYSALELDTAGVIATLQQTMGPLMPRKEDGKHADLVRIAGEWRKSSQSPHR